MGGKRTILLGAGSLALAGCALVSGLSDLDVVGDASVVDASVNDVTLDAAPGNDSSVVDASADGPRFDVVIAPDVSPPPVIAIRCGPDPKKPCAQPNVCCRRGNADAGYTQTCESAQTCPTGSLNQTVPVSCDGPSACKSGEICCAYYTSFFNVLKEIKCTTTKCDQNTEVRMCGTDGGPASTCITPDVCTPSAGSLPGYYFCN